MKLGHTLSILCLIVGGVLVGPQARAEEPLMQFVMALTEVTEAEKALIYMDEPPATDTAAVRVYAVAVKRFEKAKAAYATAAGRWLIQGGNVLDYVRQQGYLTMSLTGRLTDAENFIRRVAVRCKEKSLADPICDNVEVLHEMKKLL